MQPLAVLRFEGLDGGLGKMHLGVAQRADGAHRAKAVAALCPLDGDEALVDVAGRRFRAGGQPLPAELGAAKAADRLDQLRRRGMVRAAVERIDPLVIAEPDLRQHRPGPDALRPHLADRLLDLLREQRRVDLAGRKELLDELLVLAREPIRILVGEAREFAAQRLPERTAPVFLQAREQLDEDAVAKARPVHGDVEEAHVAELLAGLSLAAELRIDDQAADLGGPVEVVPDGEHAVPEVAVHAVRVMLLLVDVEEDVRRIARAVLGDDQRGADHLSRTRLLHHEEILPLERVADAAVEGAGGLLQDRAELPLVVGQLDGVQLGGELGQVGEIALLAVADQVHAQSSTRRDSYRSHAFSSCAISMRSSGVCAFPVLRPGPMTTASHPARANTPASVLVGLARGAGSSPCRASTAPADLTSAESSGKDIPAAFRSTETSRSSSPCPSSRTQACARSVKRAISASGSCPGKRRASSWMATAASRLSSTLRPPTTSGGSNRASLPPGSVRCHNSSSADAVASARQRFASGGRGGRNAVAAGWGLPFSRGAGTSRMQFAGTTLVPEPPRAASTGEPDVLTHSSALRMALSPRCGVELCAAFPANWSCSIPGPSLFTGLAFRSRMVQRTTAYPLCAEVMRSSLGSPHRTCAGDTSPNSSLPAKCLAPRSPTSSPNVPRSQNGRLARRPCTLRAASALQRASSFTSATPSPWRKPSRSVSIHGSLCHLSSGPGGTVSRCVTIRTPPGPATPPPGPPRMLTCTASTTWRRTGKPACSHSACRRSAACRVPCEDTVFTPISVPANSRNPFGSMGRSVCHGRCHRSTACLAFRRETFRAGSGAMGDPKATPFLTDIKELQRRAREHVEKGAVTPAYRGDVETAVRLLNEALATEIVCTLRYRRHHYMAAGIHYQAVADEFMEHAQQEQEHADRIAERIRQLGGAPDFNPEGLLTRSHAQYAEGNSLIDMIKEDLIAERIAIESYMEMIRYFGDNDPTSRRLMEDVLAKEEEHADDMATLLETLDPREADAPADAGTGHQRVRSTS